jgi:hypothetical protein
LRKKMMAAADNHALERLSPWSFLNTSLDNLDFQIKGSQPGNDSWVILVMHEDAEAVLCHIGFYTDDPTKCISRERTPIESITCDGNGELLDNAEDTIIKTREEEWNRFSFTIPQHIATTMKL